MSGSHHNKNISTLFPIATMANHEYFCVQLYIFESYTEKIDIVHNRQCSQFFIVAQMHVRFKRILIWLAVGRSIIGITQYIHSIFLIRPQWY